MDERWTRLGKALAASRRAQNLTQADVVAETGVRLSTIQGIERGVAVKDVTPSMRVYAGAVGWAQGSIEAVLAGGAPIPSSTPATAASTGQATMPAEGLPIRVAQALAEGATLDTRVIPLTSDADMVVIIKGKPAAGPDAIRAALEAWERREGHLDRLADLADDSSENS